MLDGTTTTTTTNSASLETPIDVRMDEKKGMEEEEEEEEESRTAVEDKSGPAVRTGRYARLSSFIAILCATFLFSIDNTIVAVVQSSLIADFGQIQKLPWISVSYQLGSASVNLLWGRLFHNFDHKYIFLAGLVLFEVGSVVCGAAPSLNAFIIGRVICGIGGNGIYNGTLNIIADLSSIQERPLFVAYFGVVWGAGTVLGPIIGGAFISNPHTGWRWCFYINLCVAAAFAPIYLFVLPSFSPAKGQSVVDRLKRIDYVGSVLFAGAFVTIVMGLSFGGALYPWSSASTIVPLCLTGVLWILFVIQQRYSIFIKPENRLFPVHLLPCWENCIFFMQTASAAAAQFLPIYYIPLYFQFIHGDSALESGVRLLPFVCFGIFFSLLNGAFMIKFGYYMPWFLGGSILVVIGSALMSTVSATTAYGAIYGFSIILSTGMGAYTQASIPVMQAKTPPEQSSNVVAFLVCAQKFGLTLSFCVANAVFLNVATNNIARVLPNAPRSEVQSAIAGATTTLFNGLSQTQRAAIQAAVASAIDDVYYQLVAGGVFSVILSVFMKREKLFQNKVAAST